MFDDQPHRASDGNANRARDQKGLAVVDHQRVGDSGAKHEDGTVREVEDVEDAKNERVPDCEQGVDGPDENRV